MQCFFRKGELDWITLKDDQVFSFKKTLELQLKNKNYWPNILKVWLKDKEKIVNTFYELKDKDLKSFSDNELISDLEIVFDNQLKTRRASSQTDGFYTCAGEVLQQKLEEFFKGSKVNINNIFNLLTLHETPSFFKVTRIESANILRMIIKKASLMEKFEKGNMKKEDLPNNIKNKIDEYLNKYSWIKMSSFSGGEEYFFSDLVSDMQEIMKQGLVENLKDIKENKKIRKECIKKYGFNEEIIALSDLTVFIAYWQDLRKENSMMSTFLAEKYLREIAKRKKVDKNVLSYLYFSEMKFFIKGKIKLKDFKNRPKGVYFIFKKDKFEVYKPEKVKDILDKILQKKALKAKELKGMCASPGYAKGKAKILLGIQDIDKIKEGDILVACTTRPEHLRAMKKAAAFVVEEGGVTSHAAIVSREFGIPCVIGTKIATRVFKDGDLVEVDASAGIVRKL